MHPSRAFPLRGVIVQRQAAAVRALGHDVEFVELGADGGPLRYLLAQLRVARAIRAVAPHVIHVHFGYSGLAVPPTGVPIVTTFNGDDLNGTPGPAGELTWKSRLGVVVSQYVAWRSRRCITVSATLRERLWTAAMRAKTVVVRDAVDPALFRPLPRAAARERLGIPQDAVLIIFPHTASQPGKRVWLAEAAIAELRRSVPAAQLWVVNGKPADEMPWYYGAADAMIVTSLCEGGPSSVKEALACGLPVVSVPVGDTALFAEVPEAVLAAVDRADALAARLCEVLQRTPMQRRSLLPAGLTLDATTRVLVALYGNVLAESRPGLAAS